MKRLIRQEYSNSAVQKELKKRGIKIPPIDKINTHFMFYSRWFEFDNRGIEDTLCHAAFWSRYCNEPILGRQKPRQLKKNR